MILIAILFPVVYFLLTLRLIHAIIALILMATGVGWPVASIWAVVIYLDAKSNRRFRDLREMSNK